MKWAKRREFLAQSAKLIGVPKKGNREEMEGEQEKTEIGQLNGKWNWRIGMKWKWTNKHINAEGQIPL
jgi:hypothetical protein